MRVALSRSGSSIIGRSRRLTLNYRTTVENPGWALGISAGGEFVDIVGEPVARGHRSSRRGPKRQMLDCAAGGALDTAGGAVRRWLDSGATPESSAVLARSHYERD